MNRAWLTRSLVALSIALACARATDEELTRSGDGTTGGASGSAGRPSGGSTGFGGTAGRATGGTGQGGSTGGSSSGGTSGATGEAGAGAGDMGGAGGEGTDPCSVVTGPDLRVDYRASMRAVTEDPEGHFRIVNGTSDDVSLRELSIRYWFHSEFSCAETVDRMTVNVVHFQLDNPYAGKSTSDVTESVVDLGTGAPGCDAYFELGFSEGAGSLAPGQTATVQAWTQIPIYTGPHDQTNDYSYGACTTAFAYWDRITLYRGSRLVSGREPGGSGGEGGAGGEGGGGS